MAEQRSPAYGTSKQPETHLGPWFGPEPVPAEGSDEPFPDQTDRGQAPVPSEGYQGPDLAGPEVVPQRLGRPRATLGALAQQEDPYRTPEYREFATGSLHALVGRKSEAVGDKEFLRDANDVLRRLSRSGQVTIEEDGSVMGSDLSKQDNTWLGEILEEAKWRRQMLAQQLLGKQERIRKGTD